MLYDVHTHAFHPKIAPKVLGQLQDHYHIRPKGTGLVDDLLARAKAAGLDRVVVHTAATAPAQVTPANNWAVQLQRGHDEVLAFGTIHPASQDWQEQLDRLELACIPGLKLHPDFQGFCLDDKRLWPILEAARGRFVIMVHVGDRLPPDQNPSCPMKLARILDDFPGLTVIGAHFGGWHHWRWSLEVLAGRDVWMDTSSSLPFLDDAMLLDFFRRHPSERILFGSDWPLFDPAEELERLRSRLGLTSREVEEMAARAAVLFES